jgi:acyl-CoA thioesterase FadM
VRTWVPSATAATCLRRTEISRGDELVCTAQTVWGFVDLAAGRLRRIPKEIIASFEGTEQKILRGTQLTA